MISTDVHPEIQAFLRSVSAAELPAVQDLTPAAAREQYAAGMRARLEVFPAPAVASVEDRSIPGPAGAMRVRVYRSADDAAPQPVLVWYHGGGHVIGSLDTHDAMARNLCREAGCMVVSVDYRTAPEEPFPAAVDDCAAALRWVAEHGGGIGADPERIAVGGDSAGGNLTAVVALVARDEGGPALRHQLLVYPVTDYRCHGPSYERYARGYGMLEAESMLWYRRHYLGGSEGAGDWRASPLLAADHSGLAPALVITAECDVLRDEGVAYAERLAAAGTPCVHVPFAGMIHGFFGLLGIAEAAETSARSRRPRPPRRVCRLTGTASRRRRSRKKVWRPSYTVPRNGNPQARSPSSMSGPTSPAAPAPSRRLPARSATRSRTSASS